MIKTPLSVSNKIRVVVFGSILLVNLGLWWTYIQRSPSQEIAETRVADCDVHGFRRKGYKLTRPLLMLDRECDDESLRPLRLKVQSYIDQMTREGVCESASVYFRMLDNGRNFSVNENAYSPGSMMKVVTLIAYLKMAEHQPQLLDKRFVFTGKMAGLPAPTITTWVGLKPGVSYSVNQLLEFMIVQSDNDATAMLNANLDMSVYNQVLEALELPIPDPHQPDYPLTTESMSRFFRLLYNASFLSPEMSDKALQLLTESKFRDGIVRNTPEWVTVAHKFGEKNLDGSFQLSEGGIFFTGSLDYVLIVMTRGTDNAKLKNILADVSKLVLDDLVANYGITTSRAVELTENESITNTEKPSTPVTAAP